MYKLTLYHHEPTLFVFQKTIVKMDSLKYATIKQCFQLLNSDEQTNLIKELFVTSPVQQKLKITENVNNDRIIDLITGRYSHFGNKYCHNCKQHVSQDIAIIQHVVVVDENCTDVFIENDIWDRYCHFCVICIEEICLRDCCHITKQGYGIEEYIMLTVCNHHKQIIRDTQSPPNFTVS